MVRTSTKLNGLTSWDFKVVLCVALALAVASVLLFAYEIGFANGYGGGPVGSAVSDFDFLFWLSRIHFVIAAGLVLAAAGLWSRSALGALLSGAGFICVAMVYVWWYLRTQTYIARSEVTEYTRTHDPFYRNLFFHGGTWWDFVVLVVALLVLVWLTIAVLKAWAKGSQL